MWPGSASSPPSNVVCPSCSWVISQDPISGTRRRELSGVLGRAPPTRQPNGSRRPTRRGHGLIQAPDISALL